MDAAELAPFVTWGTNPGQGLPLSASVPDPESFADESDVANAKRALEYMGLTAGTPLREQSRPSKQQGSLCRGLLP